MCLPDLVEGNAENGNRYELVSLCSAPSKADMEIRKKKIQLCALLESLIATYLSFSRSDFPPEAVPASCLIPRGCFRPLSLLFSFLPLSLPPLPCFVRWCVLHFCSFSQALSQLSDLSMQTRHGELALQREEQREICCSEGQRGDIMGRKPDVFEHTLHFLTKWATPTQGVPNVIGTQDTESSPLKMGPTWDSSLRVIPQVGGSSFCSGFLCFVWVLDIELRTLHMLSVYSTTEPHPQPHGFNTFSVLRICNRDTYFSKLICFE